MQHQFSQPWINDFYFVCRDLGFPIVVAGVVIGCIVLGVKAVWKRLSPLYVAVLIASREREESRKEEHREQTRIMNNLAERTLVIQESTQHAVEATQLAVKQTIDLSRKTYVLLERITGVSEKAADVAATAAETAAIISGQVPLMKGQKSGKQ
jgi:hypothetical protein